MAFELIVDGSENVIAAFGFNDCEFVAYPTAYGFVHVPSTPVFAKRQYRCEKAIGKFKTIWDRAVQINKWDWNHG